MLEHGHEARLAHEDVHELGEHQRRVEGRPVVCLMMVIDWSVGVRGWMEWCGPVPVGQAAVPARLHDQSCISYIVYYIL